MISIHVATLALELRKMADGSIKIDAERLNFAANMIQDLAKRIDDLESKHDEKLRDQFAMAVLNGFLSDHANNLSTGNGFVLRAYELADAMLEARK